jgi:hypothetical protein
LGDGLLVYFGYPRAGLPRGFHAFFYADLHACVSSLKSRRMLSYTNSLS